LEGTDYSILRKTFQVKFCHLSEK